MNKPFAAISRWLLLLVAIFSAGQLMAQTTKPDLGATIPVDAKVKIGKLDNGLTYYIRQNKSPSKSRAPPRTECRGDQ
ncbi:hypothetical protein [Paraflavitalea speifideaquila]|uniref:hypothetical protein n=1 Tax=Paraflavitalea speifideaquila TaxID=3076558 RepID=UPI0028E6E2F3|nr:hypothetical protein [Paraflavitalea speifideiaquila]